MEKATVSLHGAEVLETRMNQLWRNIMRMKKKKKPLRSPVSAARSVFLSFSPAERTNVCLYPADGELAAVCVQAWKHPEMQNVLEGSHQSTYLAPEDFLKNVF